MKLIITFSILLILLISANLSRAQLPNPVSSLNLFLELNMELSFTEEIYQVVFEVEKDSVLNASNYHCKIGTTEGGTEILDKSIAVDGSNAASQGVTLTTEGSILKIDFGNMGIPLDFFAEVIASDGSTTYPSVKFF